MFARETFGSRALMVRDGLNDSMMLLLTDDVEMRRFMQYRVQSDECTW